MIIKLDPRYNYKKLLNWTNYYPQHEEELLISLFCATVPDKISNKVNGVAT